MTSSILRCRECRHSNRVPSAAGEMPYCDVCHQALPWVAEADDDDFAQVAEAASIPVLVDFWAEWCDPCQMVSEILEVCAGDLAGKVKLVEVDVDHAPKLGERFKVQAIPTMMIMKDGRITAERAGAAPAPQLRAWIDEALATL